MVDLEMPTYAPSNEANAELVKSAEIQEELLSPDVTAAIKTLWADPAVKACVARSKEFQASLTYNSSRRGQADAVHCRAVELVYEFEFRLKEP